MQRSRRSLVAGSQCRVPFSHLARPCAFQSRTWCSTAGAKRSSLPEPTKESTEITGLSVVPNGREVLMALFQQHLEALKTLPEDAPYRQIMEKSTRDRLKVCEENEKISEIERIIDTAQIEELIEMAQDEINMIPVLRETRPWEAPKNHRIILLELP